MCIYTLFGFFDFPFSFIQFQDSSKHRNEKPNLQFKLLFLFVITSFLSFQRFFGFINTIYSTSYLLCSSWINSLSLKHKQLLTSKFPFNVVPFREGDDISESLTSLLLKFISGSWFEFIEWLPMWFQTRQFEIKKKWERILALRVPEIEQNSANPTIGIIIILWILPYHNVSNWRRK